MIKTLEEFFADLWNKNRGGKGAIIPDLSILEKTEWSAEFERFRKNRMIMGAFRYGLIKDQDFDNYDLTKEISRRLAAYESTGNLDYLFDIANVAMLEYIKGKTEGKKVMTGDDAVHNEKLRDDDA